MTADAACSRPTTPSTAKSRRCSATRRGDASCLPCGLTPGARVLALAHARQLRGAAVRAHRGPCRCGSTHLTRSRTRPWRRSRARFGDAAPWAEPEEAGATAGGDRWGWVEMFLAIQLLWGAALFVPGAQAYRAAVRALPYLASAAALVYYFRAPTGEPLHASARWMLASFGVLTLNLLHATTHSMAGVAQIVFQVSIAAPDLLDGARGPHRHARDAHGVAALRRQLPQLGARHPAGVLPRHVPAARVQRARTRDATPRSSAR